MFKSKHIRLHAVFDVFFVALVGTVLGQALVTLASEDNHLKEVSTPRATYPKGVFHKGQDGYVTVMFDVSKRGRVQDPCIVDSSYPGIFDLYALQAVKNYRYENKTVPRAVVEGVTTNVHFSLDSSPRDYIPPIYPETALEFGYEGYVVVQFGVKQSGRVRKLETAGALPADVFNDAGLDAARQFRFATEQFSTSETIQHKFTFSLDSEPNNLVIPEYPVEAKEQGLQGHVIVEFNINSDGSVDGVDAIYSKERIFEIPAIDAVKKFTFDPNKPARNVLHKVEFILNRDHRPIFKEVPEYPREAVFQNTEGQVVVKFDVTERGSVENLSVLEAEPPGVFNESALAAAAKFLYLPKYVDGKPVRVKNVRNRLRFALGMPSQNRAAPQNAARARPANQGQRPSNRNRQAPPRRAGAVNQNQQSAVEDRRPEALRGVKLKPVYELQLDGDYDDGSVIVQFDVNLSGYVVGPKILEMVDTGFPEEITERILDEVSFFWYAPYIENDRPVYVEGVRHKIELRFGDE